MSGTSPTSVVGGDYSLRRMTRLLLLSTSLTLASVLIDISLPPPLGLQLQPSALPIAAFIGGYFMLIIVVPSALGCAALCYLVTFVIQIRRDMFIPAGYIGGFIAGLLLVFGFFLGNLDPVLVTPYLIGSAFAGFISSVYLYARSSTSIAE